MASRSKRSSGTSVAASQRYRERGLTGSVDCDGAVESVARPLMPFGRTRPKPDFNVGGHVGFGKTVTRVIDAGYESEGGHLWTIELPRQQSPNDNSHGVTVKIFALVDEKR
jgi:hypothetical protein